MGFGSLIEALQETSFHPIIIVPLILCHRLLIATRNSHQHRHFPPPMFYMTVCKGEIGPLIMPVSRNIPPVALIPSISLDWDAKLRINYFIFVNIQKYNQTCCWRIVNGRMRRRKPSASSGSAKMHGAMVLCRNRRVLLKWTKGCGFNNTR